MIRRQEKLSAPDEEQDPHRLVVSRKVILRGAAPSFLAWLATAASMSRAASLTRKSRTRRGTNGAHALTHSKGPALLPGLAAPSSIQNSPARRGAMGNPMQRSAQRNERSRLEGDHFR